MSEERPGFLETIKGKIIALTSVVVALGGLWAAIKVFVPSPPPDHLISSPSPSVVDKQAAQLVAKEFLALMDEGMYEEGWETFDLSDRSLTENQWTDLSNRYRAPLGRLKSRTLENATNADNPPGAPPGKYISLLYQSSFQEGQQRVENLVLKLDTDGHWKMFGYLFPHQ